MMTTSVLPGAIEIRLRTGLLYIQSLLYSGSWSGLNGSATVVVYCELVGDNSSASCNCIQ